MQMAMVNPLTAADRTTQQKTKLMIYLKTYLFCVFFLIQ